jgi:hypothetical protein
MGFLGKMKNFSQEQVLRNELVRQSVGKFSTGENVLRLCRNITKNKEN